MSADNCVMHIVAGISACDSVAYLTSDKLTDKVQGAYVRRQYVNKTTGGQEHIICKSKDHPCTGQGWRNIFFFFFWTD